MTMRAHAEDKLGKRQGQGKDRTRYGHGEDKAGRHKARTRQGQGAEDKARTNPNLAMELANMSWVYAAAWPGPITWGPSPKGLLS